MAQVDTDGGDAGSDDTTTRRQDSKGTRTDTALDTLLYYYLRHHHLDHLDPQPHNSPSRGFGKSECPWSRPTPVNVPSRIKADFY